MTDKPISIFPTAFFDVSVTDLSAINHVVAFKWCDGHLYHVTGSDHAYN